MLEARAPQGVQQGNRRASSRRDGSESESVPESFLLFISDGHVSLVGGSLKLPVKILRFIQASVISFSNESHTDCWVPVVGV